VDVTDGRKRYNQLQFLTAWKVGSSPELKMYHEAKKKLQVKRADANLWVDTCRNDVQQRARSLHLTEEHEYLLMRGCKAKRLEAKMSEPDKNPPQSKNRYNSNYGWGFYLSDASDKVDQYTGGDVVDGKAHIDVFRESFVKHSVQLHEELENISHGRSAEDIVFVSVERALLGKHVEVQIDYLSCYRKQKDEDRTRMWYYRDTYAQQDFEFSDSPIGVKFNRTVPFADWDSVKAMSTTLNPEYSKDIRPGASLSPGRFNEYIVPRREQFATQYIVAYHRKWDEHNPALPIPCRCDRGNLNKTCPWTLARRPSCNPCSDGWDYSGPTGRSEIVVLPSCET
jgi:hypothetical protein